MEISFARSATKHRISRAESLRVIDLADGWFEKPPPADSGHTANRRVYVGCDSGDRPVEVMAVELDDGSICVIHAMRLRESTRRAIRTAKWRNS